MSQGGLAAVPADETAVAAAEAARDAHEAGIVADLTQAPESPTDYKLPAPPMGAEPLAAENITLVREIAHEAGFTVGEFRSVASALYAFGWMPEGLQADVRIQKMQANKMGAELERRYGEDRADTMARAAVGVIEGARAKAPQVATALRHMIVTNRPLLEMLARVGERHARR